MLESEQCSSRIFSPYQEECGDEELSVLPRHTKVIVTGNNRTKSVLVGLQGVVKKAVGLGGWHWLVLKNGIEVKLQRNALSVLEPPTGNEEDEDYEFDNSSCDSIGDNANNFCAGIEFRKLNKPRIRYMKPRVRPMLPKLGRFSSHREAQSISKIDGKRLSLANLGTSSLWRYWRCFKLGRFNPNPMKTEMVHAIQKHFASLQLDEVEVILDFINAANRRKSPNIY